MNIELTDAERRLLQTILDGTLARCHEAANPVTATVIGLRDKLLGPSTLNLQAGDVNVLTINELIGALDHLRTISDLAGNTPCHFEVSKDFHPGITSAVLTEPDHPETLAGKTWSAPIVALKS